MSEEERTELYKKALNDWGIRPQIMMVMEETGEMLNAIGKFDRGRCEEKDVITELADVWIIMEQMATFFGWNEFQKEKEFKLQRLKERLDNRYNLVNINSKSESKKEWSDEDEKKRNGLIKGL